ncbi:MAG: polysaccharide biosynthesis/export family protein [Bacteroidetes bacterium]|jgi:polysaccharide export outer membrane protein|nr:polysaccharide biosynthesis/export family protein [Bacteroidota bacterium]
MRKLFPALAILVFVVSLHSCVSPNKLYLFYDKTPGRDTLDTVAQPVVQKIQRNDRLNITVSSTDPALTAYLNPFNVQNSSSSTSQQAAAGYLVNYAGNIEFPLLGTIQVAGLSTSEASKLIKDKLSFYYKDLFVNVNLRGQVYFISGRQGTPIAMTNERLTIFEAIAQSGMQDAYDRKNQLWLVRDSVGQRIYTKLDLNSKSIFQSPYYYLQNNDLIYLQPGKSTPLLAPGSPGRNVASLSAVVVSILLLFRSL